MITLHRLFSSWQGWLSGALAVLIYFTFPVVVRWVDPTAGQFMAVFDAGFLQLLALAAVIYFTLAAFAWAGWQIAFRSLDRLYDGEIDKLYRNIPAWLSVLLIQGSFVFMALCWMWAMKFATELTQ